MWLDDTISIDKINALQILLFTLPLLLLPSIQKIIIYTCRSFLRREPRSESRSDVICDTK